MNNLWNLVDLGDKIWQENLEANMRGEFSEYQKKAIKSTISNKFGWSPFLIMTGGIILSFILGIFLMTYIGGWALLLILVAVIGIVFQIKKWHLKQFNSALSEGVQCSTGMYYFNFRKNTYEIELTGGEKLSGRLPNSSAPGTYKFYFNDMLGFLLSAEPCATQLVPAFDPQKHSLEITIKRSLNFTNADLEANRSGKMSEEQRKNYRKKELFHPTLLTIILALLLILWNVLAIVTNSDLMIALAVSAAIILFSLPMFLKTYKIYSDFNLGNVLSCSGKGSTQGSGSGDWLGWLDLGADLLGPAGNALSLFLGMFQLFLGGNKTRKYYFGGKAFDIPEKSCAVLGEGFEYTVFYLPKTKKLLSIELVSKV